MQKLAKGLNGFQWKAQGSAVVFPPRSLTVILALLKENRAREILLIEWLVLFQDKAVWDLYADYEHVVESSSLIIKAIVEEEQLTRITLFRMGLAIEGHKNVFPEILILSLPEIESFLEHPNHKNCAQILIMANDGEFESIARKSLSLGITPSKLFDQCNLSKCTTLWKKTNNEIKNIEQEIELPRDEEWFLSCIDDLQEDERVKVINKVLPRGKGLLSSSIFINWLNSNCHPENEDSLWFRLNSLAKEGLKHLIQINEYIYVRQLIKFMNEPHMADLLGHDENAQKQLRSRSNFWSNYQDNFQSVRIIVPEYTFKLLSDRTKSNLWLNTFSGDAAETEVAIFELKEYILVEFFRGTASEIRLFTKNSHHINLLLRENAEFLLSDIRKAHQDDVHDHVFLWQWSCEAWLRSKYNIVPNTGLTKFSGLPKGANEYLSLCLPTPKNDELQKRREHLKEWESSFFHREKMLGKYGGNDDELEIQRLFVKAHAEKQMSNDKGVSLYLEQAAKLGSKSAMDILSKWLLTKHPYTREERFKGEYWRNVFLDKPFLNKLD